ncbi:hypothetical protein MMC27_002249 [Xylographa pallens]|nr:hypothetical protein [Xylographa pallens]
MGFWSSLVHTAVQVTHWVSNNAGSIASAASTIAQIAGVVALTDEELAAEGDNILVKMNHYVDKAEGKLKGVADSIFPQPPVPSGSSLQVVDMSALWPSPGTSEGDNMIPPELGLDINRLLAIHGIPNTFGQNEGDDQQTDVGQALAIQLFVPADQKHKVGDNIYYNPVSLTPQNSQSPSISGGMVFYPIPLGNPGSHAAWHSHLRFYYIHSSQDDRVLREERRALSIEQGPSEVSTDEAFSSATLSVQWQGARAVAKIMSDAVNDIQATSLRKISILKPAVIDGTRFKYQFKIPTAMGPAEVAGALAASLGKAMPPPSADHALPRMPTIRVANLQTYVPKSVAST